MMNNYLAFYGYVYEPKGGMGDFIGDYNTKEEAIKAVEEEHKNKRPDDIVWGWAFAHIWDSSDKSIIYTK